MASTSLLHLHSELLLEIFRSLPHIRDASAFSQTCYTIYGFWRANTSVICTAALPRMIDSLDLATELYEVQQQTGQYYLLPKNRPCMPPQPIAQLTWVLLANYSQAVRAQAVMAKQRELVLSSDSPTFLRTWYRASTLVYLSTGRVTAEWFMNLNMLELGELEIMIDFLEEDFVHTETYGTGTAVKIQDGKEHRCTYNGHLIHRAWTASKRLLSAMQEHEINKSPQTDRYARARELLLSTFDDRENRGGRVKEFLKEDHILLDAPAQNIHYLRTE